MEDFLSRSLELLELEREAEELQAQAAVSSQLLGNPKLLESRGLCIQKLQVIDQYLGLYGREVLTFALAYSTAKRPLPLPSSAINTGSIVGVFVSCKHINDQPLSGVVVQSSSTELRVAFDDVPGEVDWRQCAGRLQLVKMANSATHKRMKKSLLSMKSLTFPPSSWHFVEVLHGEAPLGTADVSTSALLDQVTEGVDPEGFLFLNPHLDQSQKKAVLFALGQSELAVIHGPPGTGKTTTLMEVVLQAVRRGNKVLACAPSNIAVDNMVEKLARAKAKVVRLGHPARVVESVQRFSLDALLTRSDSAAIISDVRRDLEKAMTKCHEAHQSSDRRKWRTEIRVLRKELKNREEKAVLELLSQADVVLATTAGAYSDGPIGCLPEGHFGLVVIDECAQAIEASCWIALLHSTKCVLAGDHKQLPATIISQEAASRGLSTSLMERLVQLYGESVTVMLTTQYRMNEKIMKWPSEYLYDGLLRADVSVKQHCLSDLPGVSKTDITDCPLLFIDTAGLDVSELVTPDEESKGNEGEADLVLHHLKQLLHAGVSSKDMAVIAPYNLQVGLIRKRLPTLDVDCSNLEVKSVDGFQGREKEAVVISFTRSNPEGQCGFLEEVRRSNVAITRARRHLALVGDSDTLKHEPFLKGMMDYCMECGEVFSAQQYISADDYESHHFYEDKPQPATTTTSSAKSSKTSKTVQKTKPAKLKAVRDTGVAGTRVKEAEAGSGTKNRDQMRSSSTIVSEEVTEFKSLIEQFLVNPEESVLTFPSSLSSYQRMLIHEFSEKMGLLHVSKGEEPDRYIEIRKRVQHECESWRTKKEVTKGQPEVSTDAGQLVECSLCRDSFPKNNIISHETTCCKRQSDNEPLEIDGHEQECNNNQEDGNSQECLGSPLTSAASVQTKLKPKTKKKTKGSQKHKEEKSKDDDDFDSLLAAAALADSTCAHTKCKKKVTMLGVSCQFCRRRYCVEHSVPEIHGCAEEAKRHARSRQTRPGQSSSQAAKKGVLHKKLERKLETMSVGRQTKKPKAGGQRSSS